MPQKLPVLDFYTADEVDTKLAEANERLVAALEALVTQTMLAQALSPLAAKSDVAAAIAAAVGAAVAPLATKAEVEAAKAAAIREATNGRPNRSEMNRAIADAIAPLVARIAALEARG